MSETKVAVTGDDAFRAVSAAMKEERIITKEDNVRLTDAIPLACLTMIADLYPQLHSIANIVGNSNTFEILVCNDDKFDGLFFEIVEVSRNKLKPLESPRSSNVFYSFRSKKFSQEK
jgi:hypothetical protein